MAEQTAGNPSYNQIFEAQGIDEKFRNPADFFFYTVTEDDGPDEDAGSQHAGEVYAIPRTLSYETVPGFSGSYQLSENGSLVGESATIGCEDVSIGSHAVVHQKATVLSSVLGVAVEVGPGASVKGSSVGDDTSIGADSMVVNSPVGSDTRIGEKVRIDRARTVGNRVLIEDGVMLDVGTRVLDGARIRKRAWLKKSAVLGVNAEVGNKSVIRQGVQVGRGSLVLPDTVVGKRKIPPRTVVYPRWLFKKAKKVS